MTSSRERGPPTVVSINIVNIYCIYILLYKHRRLILGITWTGRGYSPGSVELGVDWAGLGVDWAGLGVDWAELLTWTGLG